MAGTDWSSLTVVKLKEECKKRGLPVGGKKAELVERLEQAEVGGECGRKGGGRQPGEASGRGERREGRSGSCRGGHCTAPQRPAQAACGA